MDQTATLLSLVSSNPQLYLSLKQKGLNDSQIVTVLSLQQKQREEEAEKKRKEEEENAKKLILAEAIEKHYDHRIKAPQLMKFSMEKLIKLYQQTTKSQETPQPQQPKPPVAVAVAGSNIEEKVARPEEQHTSPLTSTEPPLSDMGDKFPAKAPSHGSASSLLPSTQDEPVYAAPMDPNVNEEELDEDFNALSASQLRGRCRQLSVELKCLKNKLKVMHGDKDVLHRLSLEELQGVYRDLQGAIEAVKQTLDGAYYQKYVCPNCTLQNKDTVIIPCGHSFCSVCLEHVTVCPQCAQRIQRSVPLG